MVTLYQQIRETGSDVGVDAKNILTTADAQAQHLMDVYDSLGVKWGDDPFPVIAKLRACADEGEAVQRETPADGEDDEQPQRTLDIIARMLGWMNTPPRRIFEQETSSRRSISSNDDYGTRP